ncbi:protein-tyrosine phosphatase OCA1 family protein [Sporobolomyces salmoneus]|uniref:protein-tyrosine phosphatase OCA1 family protein n=1 Tax=Sporobolomyces salmoneus TaxID=183962 RepID=UPI00316F886C
MGSTSTDTAQDPEPTSATSLNPTSSLPSSLPSPSTCSAPESTPNESLPPHERLTVCRVRPARRVLIPPPNFGTVEENLYRSGQPSELSFAFIEELNLKTVLWLAPEDPNENFQQFLEDRSIKLFHLGAEDYAATYDPLSDETVLQALDLVLNPENSPTMIMCAQGRHRTGTCVGCLRKLQHWNLTSILEEYRRFAGPKVRVLNEQFIELFDLDLVHVPPPPLLPSSSTTCESTTTTTDSLVDTDLSP